MSDRSKIEWTDATWNIAYGCTRVSSGCLGCYIERQPPLRMAHRRFDSPAIGGTTGVLLDEARLTVPLRWRNRRHVFVNSLSDLFHEDIPDELIASAFAVMSIARQHTFQILTKRPARMRSLLTNSAFRVQCEDAQTRIMNDEAAPIPDYRRRAWLKQWWSDFAEPLRNVWLGVSVESQQWADIRVPQLLDTPAAVRFLSCEPLLGSVSLGSALAGDADHPDRRIGWVIVGGETGPTSRPMHPDWARSLRDQCTAAGVPFFFKQWGDWEPTKWRGIGYETIKACSLDGEPPRLVAAVGDFLDDWGHRQLMRKVGKKAAGRELDGRTWEQMPGIPLDAASMSTTAAGAAE